MPRDVDDRQMAEANGLEGGLVYVNDHDPGLSRIGAPNAFRYRDAAGRPVKDEATLSRIGALVIPPAWTSVWICPDPHGHIQATGRALPRLRARVEADLSKRGLPREKVLAAVVRLMELTLIRVGNEEYAKTNKSFGLTTLRDRHAKITGGGATFEFRGKSGKLHSTRFQDRRLARIVKSCQDIPGQRLFQYLDDDGERHSIESADVNAYIREAMGEDFSAKDFRTWAGTLSAARGLIEQPPSATAGEAKRQVAVTVKAVAALLGNTAAVCRGSYIHPLILEAYERGALPLKRGGSARSFELSVLKFLETAQESAT